jgi:hypothetical protein
LCGVGFPKGESTDKNKFIQSPTKIHIHTHTQPIKKKYSHQRPPPSSTAAAPPSPSCPPPPPPPTSSKMASSPLPHQPAPRPPKHKKSGVLVLSTHAMTGRPAHPPKTFLRKKLTKSHVNGRNARRHDVIESQRKRVRGRPLSMKPRM